MLHIFLAILKIIGILLAVILGIALFLVLSVLFWPLRYKLWVQYEDKPRAIGRITFLGPVLRLKIVYEEETTVKLRIFGIPVGRRKRRLQEEPELEPSEKETVRGRKRAGEDEIPQEPLSEDRDRQTVQDGEVSGELPAPVEEEREGQRKHKRFKLSEFLEKCRGRLRSLKGSLSRMKEFFSRICELRSDEGVRTGISKCKSEIVLLLGKIKPRSLRGYVEFGFEDPSVTGKLLAAVAVLRSMWNTRVQITPDFEKKVFRTELTAKGMIQGFRLVRTGWKMMFDKDIQYMIKQGKGIRRM